MLVIRKMHKYQGGKNDVPSKPQWSMKKENQCAAISSLIYVFPLIPH